MKTWNKRNKIELREIDVTYWNVLFNGVSFLIIKENPSFKLHLWSVESRNNDGIFVLGVGDTRKEAFANYKESLIKKECFKREI